MVEVTAVQRDDRPLASPVLLCLVLLAIGLATGQERTGKISPYDLAAATVIIIILIWALLYIMRNGRLPRPLFFLLMYASIALINVPISLAQGAKALQTIHRLFMVLTLSGIAFGTFFATNGQRQRIQVTYFALMLVCTVIGLYYLHSVHNVVRASINAIRGAEGENLWSGTGISLSGGLLFALSMPLLLANGIKPLLRIASVLTLSLASLCIALSFSRTFYGIVPLVGLAVIVIGRRAGVIPAGPYLYRNLAMLALTLLCVVVLSILALPRLAQHLAQLKSGFEQRLKFHDRSAAQRSAEAKAIVKWLTDRPTTWVTGWGLGNQYEMISVDASAVGGIGRVKRDFSHDWWLYLVLTTGVTGLVTVMTFVFSLWRLVMFTLRTPPWGVEAGGILPALSLGMAAMLLEIIGMSFTYQPFGVLLWNVVMGVLAALICSLAGCEPIECS
jgi:hypothetical protein